ncbi:OmpA family protein [Piscinibacter gummiphilus]|uniref:OmpA family protein n=1 Tax=Piscinibacter gummiphilus TaxID=946333 RepID=A0ABZ0D0I2_9BURK|nr:OmpA family protein [Piscinibacter gummiphilus]WOB10711.1 OmpA family protein [Piscinibacter gummiphilus]
MNHRTLCLSALAATLTACATGPTPNGALEQARTRVRSAQGDAQVVSLAPQELKRADDTLRLAEKAWSAGENTATIDHLAYMTGQRVTIAQDTATSLADQAVTAQASMERDRVRLAVRTSEADTAKQQLAESQRINAQKTTDLAVAKTQAERDKEMVERRDARVNNLEGLLADMKAKKTERGIVVTLGDVLFDSGKSQLRAEGMRNMAKLADAFRRDPQRTASIEGYTDSVGTESANLELSGRRADAVMAALVNLGVPSAHLTTQARGEESPIADNSTPAGRQMNRRVEIVFAPVPE